MNPKDIPKLESCKNVIRDAVSRLRSLKNNTPKIFIKIARNLGDSLHGTPIMRHYKELYPNCAICFVTEERYINAHQLNKDIDVLAGLPNDLNPQIRIELKRYIDDRVLEIDFVLCPAIFPFGEVWESHKWSYKLINHQYFVNGKINLDEMRGDKMLHAPVSEEDLDYATRFVGNNKLIAIEYHSYSHTPSWNVKNFTIFVALAKQAGYGVIAFASKNESLINGTIDGRGIDWRKTIAILSKCKAMIGIGSGVTMLAGCARPMPKIIEIGVSDSIAMKDMGYAPDSIPVKGTIEPNEVIEIIKAIP